MVKLQYDKSLLEMELIKEYTSNIPASGNIVEIGTGLGGTVLGIKESSDATIYTIDPYPCDFITKILSEAGIITLNMTSLEAASNWNYGEIDVLFIDGCHDFESLITDIEIWLPKLSTDCILIFDDYEHPTRGGINNLAVKIILDTLLHTGMLTCIQHKYRLLIAKRNRNLLPNDVNECEKRFNQLGIDNTDRGAYQKAATTVIPNFWRIYIDVAENCSDNVRSDKLARFRLSVETYRLLQLTKIINTSQISQLSRAIALQQIELNVLRSGFTLKTKDDVHI